MPTSHARGFASLALIIALVVIAAIAGGGWWYASNQLTATTVPNTASTTDALAVNPHIEVIDATSSGSLPIVHYLISGQMPADTNVWIAVVDASSQTELWGQEGARPGEGTIDLNTITKHGEPVKVAPGTYYLHLVDFHVGTQIARSSTFEIPPTAGPSLKTYTNTQYGFSIQYPAAATVSHATQFDYTDTSIKGADWYLVVVPGDNTGKGVDPACSDTSVPIVISGKRASERTIDCSDNVTILVYFQDHPASWDDNNAIHIITSHESLPLMKTLLNTFRFTN